MLEIVTTFLGWSTLVHFALLTLITIALLGMRGWMIGFHGRMFDMDPAELNRQYFQYLANYKILVMTFFLVPYLVLRLVVDFLEL